MPHTNIAPAPSIAAPGPTPAERPFALSSHASESSGRTLYSRACGQLERILRLDALNDFYSRVAGRGPLETGPAGLREFLGRALDEINVRFRLPREDLERIPRTGPLVVVSNHPFGALDGIILAAALASVRDDVKVMANYLLGRIPELRDLFIFVDPFGGAEAAAHNLTPMRESLRWLKDGGVLATFPAGEVAHLRWRDLHWQDLRPRQWRGRNDVRDRRIVDPQWSDFVARIVRRTGAPVLPVYFDGTNGPLFQLLGLVHPRLRTAMLPREFLRRRNSTIELRIGSVITPKKLKAIEGDPELTDYMRRRTYLLQHRPASGAGRGASPSESGRVAPVAPKVRAAAAPAEATANIDSPTTQSPPTSGNAADRGTSVAKFGMRSLPWRFPLRKAAPVVRNEPIIDPVSPGLLESDIAALPPEATLVEQDDYIVLHARAPQIRNVLREIGRLREVTFRAVGEGTGAACDLDTFDYDYIHLWIWNRAKSEVVGAYRLGPTDELLPAKGRLGLYTSTLFSYKQELLEQISPALEMGRSFVRTEYQRSFSPLMLLWKGIGTVTVRQPRYRYLFGPVSISNSYQSVSRQLMVQFLKAHHGWAGGDGLAQPRHPFRCRLPRGWDDFASRAMSDSDDVSDLVADLEPDQKGIPILIKQYLKLGAKFLDFNIDPQFSDTLDGLIVVDLAKTEQRVLDKYMGKAGYQCFMAYHRAREAMDAELRPASA